MTGQLAAPLHHVERVGDIAVLPPCMECDGTRTTIISSEAHCGVEGGYVKVPCLHDEPVVGQVVAHVEKCATCDGKGFTQAPMTRGMFACKTCGGFGSGWVRDQYVRVLEAIPIISEDEWMARPVTDSRRCVIVRSDGSVHFDDGVNVVPVDLPGAVPGGVAVVVESLPSTFEGYPPEVITVADDGAVTWWLRGTNEYAEQPLPSLGPVSAPSAPYDEGWFPMCARCTESEAPDE